MTTYYKVIKNGKAKDGGDFDYGPYLPVDDVASNLWTPVIENVELCSQGYHVTPYWNMYYGKNSSVYEVEVKGLLNTENIGVVDKYVCQSIRFLKRVELTFNNNNNTGYHNTGHYNTGHYNTGDRNTGHYNAGDRNTGHYNTGRYNAGRYNTGYHNTGYHNTGDRNTGFCNAGSRNTGNSNTGNYNMSDHQVGSFNTVFPKTVLFFNKELSYKKFKKIRIPDWLLYDNIQESLKKASRQEIIDTINLPNFNYAIFKKCTGISKKELCKKLNEV